LARWHQAGAFFVVRSLPHVAFRVRVSRSVDKSTGLRCDQLIGLTRFQSRRVFPQALRRIKIFDPEYRISLVLLTNHLTLPASTIALLYRKRWQAELFFKWIKQHLKLSVFFGRSPNAVRCQVWSAICAYLLVMLVKQQLGLPQTLHRILQTVSICPFEQLPLAELLAETNPDASAPHSHNQMILNLI